MTNSKTLQINVPNPKQCEFLKAKKKFIGYGGSRGGGKSWAVRSKAILLALNFAGIRIIIIRRTYPELRANHIEPLQRALKGVAVYNEALKRFTFRNTSTIKFGYCFSEGDVRQYQGQEYDVMFIDEATHFTENMYQSLSSCVRGVNTFPKRVYLTMNPGGVGHAWCKRLFIDKAYNAGEIADNYEFIRASVYDNAILLKSDPSYLGTLEALNHDLKEAWLYGNWNIFNGQFFNEFAYDRHVIEPFEIDKHWYKYAALDYGLDMLACYFIAVDEYGNEFVYREVYQSGLIVSDAAKLISEVSSEDNIRYYFAPPDLWNRQNTTGASVAELFGDNGIYLTKVSNSRVAGWMNLKEHLKIVGECSRMRIFKNCTNLIRVMPLALYDVKNVSDMANEPHEYTHAPDALRYYVSGRAEVTKNESKKIINFSAEAEIKGEAISWL